MLDQLFETNICACIQVPLNILELDQVFILILITITFLHIWPQSSSPVEALHVSTSGTCVLNYIHQTNHPRGSKEKLRLELHKPKGQ